jgi:hypothetical protein
MFKNITTRLYLNAVTVIVCLAALAALGGGGKFP